MGKKQQILSVRGWRYSVKHIAQIEVITPKGKYYVAEIFWRLSSEPKWDVSFFPADGSSSKFYDFDSALEALKHLNKELER